MDQETRDLIKKYTYLVPRTTKGKGVAIVVMVAVLMLYPGLIWLNNIEPLLFGMPFVYVWATFWAHVIIADGLYAAAKLW